MSQTIIILLGPNGVGKSHIGRLLERENLAKYYSIEEFFMERYGNLEAFKADRSNAYAEFEESVRENKMSPRILFEESGISDEATNMINRLKTTHKVILVEVTADINITLRRVKDRGTTQNFAKDDTFVINSEKKLQRLRKIKVFIRHENTKQQPDEYRNNRQVQTTLEISES